MGAHNAFGRVGENQPHGEWLMSDLLRAKLDRLGLSDFYDVLTANDVDANLIDDLTEADLRELGLTLGQRKRFLRARAAQNGDAPAPPGHRLVASHGAATVGERRQLTSMFCDLVGSTPLSLRLDPEDFSEVIRVFQDTCAGVITRGGGYVARYQGDGVLAHFGYPRAREDDAQSAARAALVVVAKVSQLRTPDGEPLTVRVGIATGLVVVVGEYSAGGFSLEQSIIGETLNLAARLQATAGPGEIVISEATRRLCGGMFEYEKRGDIVLKGFPEPLTIYRLRGEGSAQSRFDARTSSGLNLFVGREREFDALLASWSAARASRGQIVHVSGEPGIGKSRLALTLIERLGRESAGIVRWNCAAHLANRALHPIVRDIETRAGFSRSLSDEARRAAIDALVAASPTLSSEDGGFLNDLLGIETEPRPELDAASRARRIYGVLARWLAGMARDTPLLILVEDAHWADAATLDFLTMLTDRIARLSALLLITHRPEFTPPWSQAKQATTIALDPLDVTAGSQLLAAVVRDRLLPPSVMHTILRKAGGVPLYVEELAYAILDAVPGLSSTVSLEVLTIPATLQDSLMARLDQLGQAKELAQIGSVIGREFTAAMLRAVAPDHPDIEGGLRRLCDSGLAREHRDNDAAGIAFHHALIQDAAYDSLLKKRRRDLHRAVAEAMLAQDPAFAGAEPELIARHCSRGGLAEPAVSHWLAAGLHALDRAANAPALTYLRSALEDLEHLPRSAESAKTELAIQMALAPAAMAIHGWASKEVETACSRAHEIAGKLDDPESMFGSAWGLWTHYFLRGEMELALATAQRVDAMATAASSTLLLVAADHAVGFTHYFRGNLAAALERAHAGVARFNEETERKIVRMFQFSSTTAMHAFEAAALWMVGRETEADAALERSLALPERLGHAPSVAFSLAFTQYTLMYKRDWSRVRTTAKHLLELSESEGFQMWIPQAQTFLGLCDAAEGDLDRGLAFAIDGFKNYAATGTGLTLIQLVPSIADFLISAGRYGEAVQRLNEAIESSARRRESAYLSELFRARGLAHQSLGARKEAQDDVAMACDFARSQGATTLLRRAEESLRAIAAGTGRPLNHKPIKKGRRA
jgi:class 3 adenylate cyclase/ABC-type transport system involved in cytochrome c biogenesis ATPase subunit